MATYTDGPASERFSTAPLTGGIPHARLGKAPFSKEVREHWESAPQGDCVCWGIPFAVGGRVVVARDAPLHVPLAATVRAPWLVFLHNTAWVAQERDGEFVRATRGHGRLAEPAADYVLCYTDGTEARRTLRRRHEIGMMQRPWGENCFEAVAQCKPFPLRNLSLQHEQAGGWGWTQTGAANTDMLPWTCWLWAWENPHPGKALEALRIEPHAGPLFLFGLSAGRVSSHPLRWGRREKAILKLPRNEVFDPAIRNGCYSQVQLDLGQVISAEPRLVYPDDGWTRGSVNTPPEVSSVEVLVEYTAHSGAAFHLPSGRPIPLARVSQGRAPRIEPIAPARQRVRLRVVEGASSRPAPVKLHVHGPAGEYIAPIGRHRYPNDQWFEDYSVDFVHAGTHRCTYIDGEAELNLPLGTVFLEISKGVEIKPVRKAVRIGPRKKEITIRLERVLDWRGKGWVSADTHVHFISPTSGLLEGAAEGVNVVNLLASQWGELFTNIGDFDGKTTHGAVDAGGDGEYLLRVGTENRQHVLGHISLLGYGGRPITPLTTGGPDESALGDPVEALLTEWARQCRSRGGLVVLPHFPQPRAENAAVLIDGSADAVEMTSWGNLYHGIDPYALSDWYRYLNCGYFVPAVAGTDKMSANTPVGCIRTYARLGEDAGFTYAAWMEAVRRGNTFVTYGPLMEFFVEGHAPGQRLSLPRGGGRLSVHYTLASATTPMVQADLVVNGMVRESRRVKPWSDSGYWEVEVEESAWLALLVRGQYPDQPEMIAAHSSAVAVQVGDSPFYQQADALTILEQIEGAMAFFDTMATETDPKRYKEMRMTLTSIHRKLHNRMHALGHGHVHSPEHHHHDHDA